MNIAEAFIKNNRIAAVFFLAVIVMGIVTFCSMSRLEDPEVAVRAAVVITDFPGASPERVEMLVTDKIEKKVRELSEIDYIESQSLTGTSIVTISLKDTIPKESMPNIWQKLRNKVDEADLPAEAGIPFVNDEFGDVYGLLIAIKGDTFSYREKKDIADDTRDDLLLIDSVGKVEIHGIQQEQVFVEFSNARLAEFGISPTDIANILATENIIKPSGNARVETNRIVIEASGEFKTVDQIKKVAIRPPNSDQSLYLSDVAEITRGYVDPPNTMVRVDSEPVILLAISVPKAGNVITMTDDVLARIDQLQHLLPAGMEYQLLYNQAHFVDENINGFVVNLAESIGFVIIVMLLFTGIRMGLIAGALIPMAILANIAIIPFFGVALETVSIAALIIALGMLVDNGVVISENVLVRISRGEDRLKAVTDTVAELWLPLLAASLTTIFAFLPIPLAKSSVGEYTFSLFIVITMTLLFSWFFSLTFIPMLSYYFLKPAPTAQSFKGKFYTFYRSLLLNTLKRPLILVGIVLALFVTSLWGFQFVPKVFFPPNEREMFLVDFWQPYGVDIRTTRDQLAKLEDFVRKQEGVNSIASFIGYGGPRWYLPLDPEQSNDSYAMLMVNMQKGTNIAQVMSNTRLYLHDHFPNTRGTVKMLERGVPVGTPIQIRLSGPNKKTLYDTETMIFDLLRAEAGVVNIRDDWGEWTQKLMVDVNQDQAKRASLTSQDIALSLQTQISGLNTTNYREEDEVIPIMLRSKKSYREDIGNIEGLNVYSYQNNTSVPLQQVAKTEMVWQPSNIRRRNAMRTMNLQADLVDRIATDALRSIQPKIDELMASEKWPAGYNIEYGGEQEESAKAQASVFEGLPIAFILIVLILVSQFNSIRRTIIILLTIPPMLIGITPGLILTQAPFGFMALLGLISLVGIIVNNAIMLIDSIETERKKGLGLEDAVVLSAQSRMRPIIMTATTTVIGLLPLALQGGEMWRPMANTIIFGLAFSTLLTLILCPVLYSLFFKSRFDNYQWNEEKVMAVSNA